MNKKPVAGSKRRIYIAERDWNAAINILNETLQMPSKATVGHTGSDDYGENELYLVQPTKQRKSSGKKSNPKK